MSEQFEVFAFWAGWFFFAWTIVGLVVSTVLVALFGESVYRKIDSVLEGKYGTDDSDDNGG